MRAGRVSNAAPALRARRPSLPAPAEPAHATSPPAPVRPARRLPCRQAGVPTPRPSARRAAASAARLDHPCCARTCEKYFLASRLLDEPRPLRYLTRTGPPGLAACHSENSCAVKKPSSDEPRVTCAHGIGAGSGGWGEDRDAARGRTQIGPRARAGLVLPAPAPLALGPRATLMMGVAKRRMKPGQTARSEGHCEWIRLITSPAMWCPSKSWSAKMVSDL